MLQSSTKEFEESYERMAKYVVPKSGKLISEDSEYALYTWYAAAKPSQAKTSSRTHGQAKPQPHTHMASAEPYTSSPPRRHHSPPLDTFPHPFLLPAMCSTLFKKCLEEFKLHAREKRYTLRDFTYDPNAVEADKAKKASDERELDRLRSMLANWCHINYAECYTMMLHLKAVRVFVESVLRYGLTTDYQRGMVPNFKAFLLQPKKGVTEKLRKSLAALYGGANSLAGDAEEEMVVPGATGEFYPYVSTDIVTEPVIAS